MASKQLRERPDLQRKRRTRQEKSRILIVTEGTVTEPAYFQGLSRFLKETGVQVWGVDVCGEGKDPMRVVRRAKKETSSKVARADKFDSVWCIFDVDDHHTLEEAIARALEQGFQIAVSNPCIEIWLLWHYQDYGKHSSPETLKRLLRKHGMPGKQIPLSFAFRNFQDAIRRGRLCAAEIPDNPGSTIGSLVQVMNEGLNGDSANR
jgi:hypothetical protein